MSTIFAILFTAAALVLSIKGLFFEKDEVLSLLNLIFSFQFFLSADTICIQENLKKLLDKRGR